MSDERDGQGEAYHQMMLDREREAAEALQKCADAGADMNTLKVLARECGLTNWKPERRI